MIVSKIYSAPDFCKNEILKYAGCKEATEKISDLMEECISEANGTFKYKVCYRELKVTTDNDICDFDLFSLKSCKLASNLSGCKKVIVFAATVGVGIDRLIAKYSSISPSKALMFQAIGTERIEALCNTFCADISAEYNMGLKPRFSPGYGDLSLECQKDIFSVLDCERKIGLTLNESLLMSPSKSVTAFVGLCKDEKQVLNKCSECDKNDCIFRGV